MPSAKVRFPIGVKLSIMVSLLLALALSVITAMVAVLVRSDVRLTAENNNWTINRWSALAAENMLAGVKSRSLLFIRNVEVSAEYGAAGPSLADISGRFYRLNPDIACVAFLGAGESASGIFINDLFGTAGQFTQERIASWLDGERDSLLRAAEGGTLLFNGYPRMGIPFLVMLFPLPRERGFSLSGAGAVFFSAESLASLLAGSGGESGGGTVTFMVNGEGDALIRGEGGLVREASNLKNLAIVERALEGKAGNLQTLYTDEEGTEYFGAFQRLAAADAVVFTGVESRIVFAGIDRVTRGVVVIGGAVLALSVLFIILYSRTISRPVRVLAAAAGEVEAGNYQPALAVKSRDEVGALTESFIAMGNGLANFERFTNKAIVALARRGILGRTGERKTVTVCFAQIRNFEELTGGMSPRAEVGFVNHLLARMVPCITKTGGLVDKFLTQDGLVVMAHWGAALNADPRAGAFHCVRSALMMRAALRRVNRRRRGRAPLVKMGCGINTGEVIAGQMGSDKRIEYTVIGDTVNFAARIEEPNAEFDTDILITENTWNLAGRGLVTEALPGLAIKGVSKDLRVFAVVGLRGVYGPKTMEDVRRLWQI